MLTERITFTSGNDTLVGHLYVAESGTPPVARRHRHRVVDHGEGANAGSLCETAR